MIWTSIRTQRSGDEEKHCKKRIPKNELRCLIDFSCLISKYHSANFFWLQVSGEEGL